MDLARQPLLFSLTPDLDESLVGFLIRLTQANHLGSPYALLKLAGAKPQQPPTLKDVPGLAILCNCHPDQLVELFGFTQRMEKGYKAWRIGGQWITKPYFVSSRSLSYCPACLAEKDQLRAIWELTLYRVCARHEIKLLDSCPACSRATTWMRGLVGQCLCGFQFGMSPRIYMGGFPLLLSSLVEQSINASSPIKAKWALPMELLRRMQELSLDGLCKTIWLLGACLDETLPQGGRRLTTPHKIRNAVDVIGEAGRILNCWPDAFISQLDKLRHQNIPTHSGALIARMFGGVHHYLIEEMTDDEFLFLRLTYERYIRDLWRVMNKLTPLSVSAQLELQFQAAN